MLYNEVEIEGIKLAAYNMEGAGISSKEILLKSITWLREYYEIFKQPEFLEKAVWHIYAYLGLGYPYEDGESEFLYILRLLGKEREELFPKRKWIYKKIALKKSNVRNLLGKWNPGLQSMKITDVVEDIIEKVSKKKEGVYEYHCGKTLTQCEGKSLWEHTFKLYVRQEEAIFHDINQNRYYIFQQEALRGDICDKSSNCR